ncbi:MAG: histidine phosphatase family protein, partial [Sinobacteraceae bacterium]|nr:histidine phosphatase family protein [Nevskiaceae bacterium]
MKRLTLMRHADAQWRDPNITDFDRPLNRRGSAEAEAMSRRLGELGLVPAVLLTSTARRAQQTAEIVARQLGMATRLVHCEESLYLAAAPEILRLV